MAARQPCTICLSCRHQQRLLSKRRLIHCSARRRLEAVALSADEDGFAMSDDAGAGRGGAEGDKDVNASSTGEYRDWKLQRSVDEIREALLGFESLVKRRDMRLEVLRNLSNPWPQWQQEHPHKILSSSKDTPELPEARAATVPHIVFRERMRNANGGKPVRLLIRSQLLRCEWPKDIFRVVAVAMQSRVTAQHLAVLHEPLMRALYRCRNNVSDPDVLSTINAIVTRLAMAGISAHEELINMGLKFAARSRSVRGMSRYLRIYRQRGLHMSSNVFRSVIAKFSIGHRGLGEIRNGRWRRSDLMKVLTGFDDAQDLLPEQQYHLGTFLQREDWQYLHGWIAVLARCKASDVIWEEWQMWKQSDARVAPKKLHSVARNMNTRVRGDYWFVEQMSCTSDQKRAWRILEETEIPFSWLKGRVKNAMLDEAECTSVWTPQIREAMLEKYDTELSKIERAFGVVWEASDEDGQEGRHVLFKGQEEALDDLGANSYKPEEDFGFPYEASHIVPAQERMLHDAEEGGLAASLPPADT